MHMTVKEKIIFATKNAGKIKEINEIMADSPMRLFQWKKQVYILQLLKMGQALKKMPL